MITYRHATKEDLNAICFFSDYWLAGRGKSKGVPGSSNDCFVSKGQHAGYLKLSVVLLAFDGDQMIAWAVKHRNDTLIHMLVAAPYRGKGIGKTILKMLNPSLIRSKIDQSTGDPTPFYESNGYQQIATVTSKPSYKIPAKRNKPLKNVKVLARKTSEI